MQRLSARPTWPWGANPLSAVLHESQTQWHYGIWVFEYTDRWIKSKTGKGRRYTVFCVLVFVCLFVCVCVCVCVCRQVSCYEPLNSVFRSFTYNRLVVKDGFSVKIMTPLICIAILNRKRPCGLIRGLNYFDGVLARGVPMYVTWEREITSFNLNR